MNRNNSESRNIGGNKDEKEEHREGVSGPKDTRTFKTEQELFGTRCEGDTSNKKKKKTPLRKDFTEAEIQSMNENIKKMKEKDAKVKIIEEVARDSEKENNKKEEEENKEKSFFDSKSFKGFYNQYYLKALYFIYNCGFLGVSVVGNTLVGSYKQTAKVSVSPSIWWKQINFTEPRNFIDKHKLEVELVIKILATIEWTNRRSVVFGFLSILQVLNKNLSVAKILPQIYKVVDDLRKDPDYKDFTKNVKNITDKGGFEQQSGLMDLWKSFRGSKIVLHLLKILSMCVSVGYVKERSLDFKGIEVFSLKAYNGIINIENIWEVLDNLYDSILNGLDNYKESGSWLGFFHEDSLELEISNFLSQLTKLSAGDDIPGLTLDIFADRCEGYIRKCTIKITNGNGTERSMFNQYMNRLIEARTTAEMLANEELEQELPFAVSFFGPSSVGKSFFVPGLMRYLLELNGFPSQNQNVMTYIEGRKYDDGVTNQTYGLLLDDLANLKPGVGSGDSSVAGSVLRMINVVSQPTNQADLSLKGKIHWRSKVVIATTNRRDLNAHTDSHNPASILRRFLHIGVSVKPQYRKNGSLSLDGDKVIKLFPNNPFPDVWDFSAYEIKIGAKEQPVWCPLLVDGLASFGVERLVRFLKNKSLAHFAFERKTLVSRRDFTKFKVDKKTGFPVGMKNVNTYGSVMDFYTIDFANSRLSLIDIPESDLETMEPHQLVYLRKAKTVVAKANSDFNNYISRMCNNEYEEKLESLSIADREKAQKLIDQYEFNLKAEENFKKDSLLPGTEDYEYYFKDSESKKNTGKVENFDECETEWRQESGQSYDDEYCSTPFFTYFPEFVWDYWMYCGSPSIFVGSIFIIGVAPFVGLLVFNYDRGLLLYGILLYTLLLAIYVRDLLFSMILRTIITRGAKGVLKKYLKKTYQKTMENKYSITMVLGLCATAYGMYRAFCYEQQINTEEGKDVWYKNKMPVSTHKATATATNKQVVGRVLKNQFNVVCGNVCSNALMVRNNILIMPLHCAENLGTGVWSFTRVLREDPQKREIHIDIDSSQIVKDKNMDFAMIYVTGLCQVKSIENCFSEADHDVEHATMTHCSGDENFEINIEVTARKTVPVSGINYDGWVWKSKTNASRGMCGSAVIAHLQHPYIMGYHVAGKTNGTRGVCQFLSLKYIKNKMKEIEDFHTPIVNDEKCFELHCESCTDLNTHPFCPTNLDAFSEIPMEVIGAVPGTGKRRMQVRKTPFNDQIHQHFGTEEKFAKPPGGAAIVDGELRSPWRRGLEEISGGKSVFPQGLLDRAIDEVKDLLCHRLHEYCNSSGAIFRPLHTSECFDGIVGTKLSGVNWNTSCGLFPTETWKHLFGTCFSGFQYKVKKDWIVNEEFPYEVDEKFCQVVEYTDSLLRMKIRPVNVLNAALKDEPLKKNKCEEFRTRIFFSDQFHILILVMKYFGPVLNYLTTFPFNTRSAVGLNPMSHDWEQLRNYLLWKDTEYSEDKIQAIYYDFKAFDKTLPENLMKASWSILIHIAQSMGYSEDDLNAMQTLSSLKTTPVVNYNGTLLQLLTTHTSGNGCTAPVGSIAGMLSLYVGYYSVVDPKGWKKAQASDVLRNIHLGDDVACTIRVQNDFNFLSLQKVYEEMGIIITMPDKESIPTAYQCMDKEDFLKRTFRWCPERVSFLGTLAMSSIIKSLCWFIPSKVASFEVQLGNTVDAALMESALHGREIFGTVRTICLELIAKYDLRSSFEETTYDDFLIRWARDSGKRYPEYRAREKPYLETLRHKMDEQDQACIFGHFIPSSSLPSGSNSKANMDMLTMDNDNDYDMRHETLANINIYQTPFLDNEFDWDTKVLGLNNKNNKKRKLSSSRTERDSMLPGIGEHDNNGDEFELQAIVPLDDDDPIDEYCRKYKNKIKTKNTSSGKSITVPIDCRGDPNYWRFLDLIRHFYVECDNFSHFTLSGSNYDILTIHTFCTSHFGSSVIRKPKDVITIIFNDYPRLLYEEEEEDDDSGYEQQSLVTGDEGKVVTKIVDEAKESTVSVNKTPRTNLNNFIEREIYIGTADLSEDFQSQIFNVYDLVFENRAVKDKMVNYALLEFDRLNVRLTVNATQYIQGLYMVTYHPQPGKDIYKPDLTRENMTRLSQLPCIYINLNSNESYSFPLTPLYSANALSIRYSDWRDLGYIAVTPVVPIKSASGTPAVAAINIYAKAEGVTLSGATSWELQSGLISKPAKKVEEIADLASEIPVIGKYARKLADVSRITGKVAGFLGLTPEDRMDLNNYKSYDMSATAATDLTNNCRPLTFNAAAETTIDPNVLRQENTSDPMSFKDICGKETILDVRTWRTSYIRGTPLISFPVCPFKKGSYNDTFVSDTGDFDLTPAGMLSTLFNYWRGNETMGLYVICTSKHQGRLRVYWEPEGSSNVVFNSTYNVTEGHVMDISQKQTEFFTPGWMATKHWLKVPEHPINAFTGFTRDTCNGRIVVVVEQPLSVPMEESEDNIQIVLTTKGEYQFFDPTSKHLGKMTLLSNTLGDGISPAPESQTYGDIVPNTSKSIALFFYPWYTREANWDNSLMQNVENPFLPSVNGSVGLYTESDRTFANAHVREMINSGADYIISSWGGIGHRTDDALKNLYSVEMMTMKFCVLWELTRLRVDGQSIVNADVITQLREEMSYIKTTYFVNAKYWTRDFKPVLYLYLLRSWSDEGQRQILAAIHSVCQDDSIGGVSYTPYIIADLAFGTPKILSGDTLDLIDEISVYDVYGQAENGSGSLSSSEVTEYYDQWNEWSSLNGNKKVMPVVSPMYNDRAQRVEADHFPLSATLSDYSDYGSLFKHSLNQIGLIDNCETVAINSWNEHPEGSGIEPTGGTELPSVSEEEPTLGVEVQDHGTLFQDILSDFADFTQQSGWEQQSGSHDSIGGPENIVFGTLCDMHEESDSIYHGDNISTVRSLITRHCKVIDKWRTTTNLSKTSFSISRTGKKLVISEQKITNPNQLIQSYFLCNRGHSTVKVLVDHLVVTGSRNKGNVYIEARRNVGLTSSDIVSATNSAASPIYEVDDDLSEGYFEGTEMASADNVLEVRIPYYDIDRFKYNRTSTVETSIDVSTYGGGYNRFRALCSYDGIEYYVPLNVPRIRFT